MPRFARWYPAARPGLAGPDDQHIGPLVLDHLDHPLAAC